MRRDGNGAPRVKLKRFFMSRDGSGVPWVKLKHSFGSRDDEGNGEAVEETQQSHGNKPWEISHICY